LGKYQAGQQILERLGFKLVKQDVSANPGGGVT